MSGPAPGTRLKTKTSGLSDFFGAHNQHTNATRPSPKKLPATPSRISPPQNTQQAELSSSTKSKKSSIPFWGKRKSGGAAPSPSPSKRKPTPASPPPPVPRLSGSSGTRTNNGASSTLPPRDPHLPSRLPPINVSPPTLSSKFAAHFTPSKLPATKPPVKSRGIYGSIHAPSPPISPSSLSFPSPTRSTYRSIPSQPPSVSQSIAASTEEASDSRPSVDTHRSSTSTTRPTPVTVSISPPEEFYKDDDYMDKFTVPRSPPMPPAPTSPESSKKKWSPEIPSSPPDIQAGNFDVPNPSPDILGPNLSSNGRMQFPNPPTSLAGLAQNPRPLYTEDKDYSNSGTSVASDDPGASVKLKSTRSMRKHSISVVRALEDALGTPVATDLDSDDGSDSDTIPTPNSISDLGADSISLVDLTLRRPRRQSSLLVSIIPEQQQAENPPQQHQQSTPPQRLADSPIAISSFTGLSIKSSNSSVRSVSKAGPPPTSPLPSPPTYVDPEDSMTSFSSLPSIPSMNSLPSRRSSSLIQNSSVILSRPRAKTISAVTAPSPSLRINPTTSSRSLTSSNASSRRHSKARPEDTVVTDDRSNKENKRKPTYEELELALAESQGQYSTLTAYLKTVSEKLEREKAAVREEADMWQKEADLWRHEAKSRAAEVKKREVEIEGLKWLILHPMPPADRSKDEQDDDDASTEAGSLASSVMFSSDSGSMDTDSPTRPESSRKRSMTIHDFRFSPQKFRQTKSTTNLPESSSSNNSALGLGLHYAVPDVPYTKWTAETGISTSSAASSTSSLAIPGLTATNTVSSGLSAIPESPSQRPLDATADVETEKQRGREERRSSRVLRRASGSSLVSSTSIATHAYANNLRAGRGPSIEQVLDQPPPNMEGVAEKLRPLGSI